MTNINLELEASFHLNSRFFAPYITGEELHTPFGTYTITALQETELREKGYVPHMSTEGGYYIVFANNNGDYVAFRNF